MPENFKPFTQMAVYILAIALLAYGAGWLILGKSWTQTSWTEDDTGRFISEVRSYSSHDKRIISGLVARTEAQWHVQCDNQGGNKIYLTFDRPLATVVPAIKLFWDDRPPQEYNIQSVGQEINLNELPESAQQEIRERLHNSLSVGLEVNLGASEPNVYKWDLYQG